MVLSTVILTPYISGVRSKNWPYHLPYCSLLNPLIMHLSFNFKLLGNLKNYFPFLFSHCPRSLGTRMGIAEILWESLFSGYLQLIQKQKGLKKPHKKNSSHKTVQPNLADKRDANSFKKYSDFGVVLSPDLFQQFVVYWYQSVFNITPRRSRFVSSLGCLHGSKFYHPLWTQRILQSMKRGRCLTYAYCTLF